MNNRNSGSILDTFAVLIAIAIGLIVAYQLLNNPTSARAPAVTDIIITATARHRLIPTARVIVPSDVVAQTNARLADAAATITAPLPTPTTPDDGEFWTPLERTAMAAEATATSEAFYNVETLPTSAPEFVSYAQQACATAVVKSILCP